MGEDTDTTVTVDAQTLDDHGLPFGAPRTVETVGEVSCLPLNRPQCPPATLGTLLCNLSGSPRLVVICKAAFSMESTPMEAVDAPPIHLRDV